MTDDTPEIAEARRKAEQARAKLFATAEEMIDHARGIKRKLTPANIAHNAWDAAKSKGADVAEDAVDAVRKRPVMASSAVAALALFIAREPLMDLANKWMATKPKKPRKARKPKQPVETSND